MTPLQIFVAHSWAATVGWTLLHSLWQGAILSALLTLVLLATNSPRIRYAAACASMFILFAAFLATLLYLWTQTQPSLLPVKPLPFPRWNAPVAIARDAEPLSLATLAPWLAPFWIIGVFVFYVRLAAGFFAVSRLRHRGICAPPGPWQQGVDTLRTKLRITRPVQLFESALAETPMVIGHLRPLILMPIGLLAGLPTSHIEAILLHELAHIRRHDFLLNTLQTLLEGLLFYNPATWFISHIIPTEREKCCDDLVVHHTGNAHEYARALAALEQSRWSGHEPALAAKGGSLMKRIHRLLYPQRASISATPLVATALLLLCAGLTLSAWQNDPPRSHVLQACGGTIHNDFTTTDAFNKWLNEDVVYLIDDAERAAFLKLTTNDERACFVDQFWERRNPTPGSAENKFKIEHYRRITFANKRYSASVPGWQTDRGHMYIVYGPPDEIETHPKGGADRPFATEDWAYRHVEGTRGMSFFTFIDKTGKGDYHLAPSNGH